VIFQNPDPDKLVTVFENIDPTPVEMARDYLKDAAIESFVFGASSVLGGSVPTRLMVRADAAKEARERLTELGILNGDSGSYSAAEGAPLRWFGVPKSRFREEARRRSRLRRMGLDPPPSWMRVLAMFYCSGAVGFMLFAILGKVVFNSDAKQCEKLGFLTGGILGCFWAYRHRQQRYTRIESVVMFFGFALFVFGFFVAMTR
jgi:hypothetical protein